MDEVNGAAGSSAEDLETMLQMVWLRFDGVRRDEGLYKSFMDNQVQMSCATATPCPRCASSRRRDGHAVWGTPTARTLFEPTAQRSTWTAASPCTASAFRAPKA
jgi:hypothetical protein